MSVQAFGWVLDRSEAQGLERLVLQSHANNARGHEPPWISWTGIDTVVHESRATRRGVQKATQRLVKAKRLLPTGERRGQGTLVYEIAVDADADRVDREARLARQEQERGRPRRGANGVRPTDPDDSDATGGEQGSPLTDEQSSPPVGEQDSPTGANFETPRGELEDASAEPSSPKPSVTDEPSAANAAAAGEPAATDRSSSDVQEPRREDLGLRWWDVAVQLLTAGDIGFTEDEVLAQRPALLAVIRRNAAKLPDWPWTRVTEQVITGRKDGSIVATTPVGVLAFALGQRIPTGSVPSAAPSAASSASARDGLTIPDGDETAAIAWRQLVDALRETPQWAEIDRSFGQALPLVKPLTLVGGVLRITGTQHAMYMLEKDAIPVLDAFASQCLNGRVVLVPRDEAARG